MKNETNKTNKKIYKIQYKYPSGKIEEIVVNISSIEKFEQCRKRLETLAKYSYWLQSFLNFPLKEISSISKNPIYYHGKF